MPSRSSSAPFHSTSFALRCASSRPRQLTELHVRLRKVGVAHLPGPARHARQREARPNDAGERLVVAGRPDVRCDSQGPGEEIEHKLARPRDRRQPPLPRAAVVPYARRDPRKSHAPCHEPRPRRRRSRNRTSGSLRATSRRPREHPLEHLLGRRPRPELDVVAMESPGVSAETAVSEPDGKRRAGSPPGTDSALVFGDVLERIGERDVARKIEGGPDDRREPWRRSLCRRALLRRRRVRRHVAEDPLDRDARGRTPNRLERRAERRVVQDAAVDHPGVARERGDPGQGRIRRPAVSTVHPAERRLERPGERCRGPCDACEPARRVGVGERR